MRRSRVLALMLFVSASCHSFGDGSSGPTADAGAGTGPADGGAAGGPTMRCGTLACPLTGGCCIDGVDGGRSCAPNADTCGASNAFLLCGRRSDCEARGQGTQICCASTTLGAVGYALQHAECIEEQKCSSNAQDVLCDEVTNDCRSLASPRDCQRSGAYVDYMQPVYVCE
jgi:hypothetical protein